MSTDELDDTLSELADRLSKQIEKILQDGATDVSSDSDQEPQRPPTRRRRRRRCRQSKKGDPDLPPTCRVVVGPGRRPSDDVIKALPEPPPGQPKAGWSHHDFPRLQDQQPSTGRRVRFVLPKTRGSDPGQK